MFALEAITVRESLSVSAFKHLDGWEEARKRNPRSLKGRGLFFMDPAGDRTSNTELGICYCESVGPYSRTRYAVQILEFRSSSATRHSNSNSSLRCLLVLAYDRHMLGLKCDTSDRWRRQVDEDLDTILIDHAHCEKKAAATAMKLIVAYVDNDQLCRDMTEIVNEELEHFHMVLAVLKSRGIPFRRLKPSPYAGRLHDLADHQEPQRAVDRLLIAGLIEARSCERFSCLRDHVEDADLAEFYGNLFESEARHHATYVRLARDYAAERAVLRRLDELAEAEARILTEGADLARMHS